MKTNLTAQFQNLRKAVIEKIILKEYIFLLKNNVDSSVVVKI